MTINAILVFKTRTFLFKFGDITKILKQLCVLILIHHQNQKHPRGELTQNESKKTKANLKTKKMTQFIKHQIFNFLLVSCFCLLNSIK